MDTSQYAISLRLAQLIDFISWRFDWSLDQLKDFALLSWSKKAKMMPSANKAIQSFKMHSSITWKNKNYQCRILLAISLLLNHFNDFVKEKRTHFAKKKKYILPSNICMRAHLSHLHSKILWLWWNSMKFYQYEIWTAPPFTASAQFILWQIFC